jgi:DNA-binding CsgD family transcriptional regulator
MENGDRLARLTEREKVCLRLWLQHKSAKEIAADLRISHHAVEKRLKMARTKVGATSSLEAARMLSEAEGYGRTVAQTPDLPPHTIQVQSVFTPPLIFGVIAMILFGAAVLAVLTPPTGEISAPEQTGHIAQESDEQLTLALMTMIASAVVEPNGEILLTYPLGQRFMERDSGYYWQISAVGQEDFASRSLWNRRLEVSGRKAWGEPLYYNSTQFPNEPLRVAERTVILPNSSVEWQFLVARSRDKVR